MSDSRIEHILYPMPDPSLRFLAGMVEVAERDDLLSVTCTYELGGDQGWHVRGRGGDSFFFEGFGGQPADSLSQAGFISPMGNGNYFLHPIAFDRVRYERKNRFLKWFERATRSGLRDNTVALLAFVVVVFSTLLPALIEIAQIWGYLPVP